MQLTAVPNPLREGLRLPRTPEPCIMVIFGASGDLTHRKLIPALYSLAVEGLLPTGFTVVAVARRPIGTENFRKQMREAVEEYARVKPVRDDVWESFAQGLIYLQANFNDSYGYDRLHDLLEQIDNERGTGHNHLFYLATPPNYYPEIIQELGAHGLNHSDPGWTRIIIEKPFGHDLESARELNREVAEIFNEDQVFRIDHYLGKETVQNILVFRFANGIWEPLWNRDHIDHVQITVSEQIGIEGRGNYFEQAGAIRDMVQNHMLQLLSLVAMEPPVAFQANDVRDEKVKVLRSIRLYAPEDVPLYTVRGQYGPGTTAGEQVPGYRSETNVAPNSMVETYVALKLFVDNWRWSDVPFYLRTGKALPKRISEISIQFREPPYMLFRDYAGQLRPNVLSMRIQPDEGISLMFEAKVPGPTMDVRPVNMEFRYGASFGEEPPEAYERLLLDAMLGDSTLFTRRDEVEAAWTIVNRIMEGWKLAPPPSFPNYEAGIWGPAEAETFIEEDGRTWRRL